MAGWYLPIKHFHLLTVFITIVLFILRFYWFSKQSTMLTRRWVRIVPHINDTLLLLSGVLLVILSQRYPLLSQDSWLTEKIAGVVVYIALGFVALGRRPRAQKVRWIAFIIALAVVALVIRLAITKMPLLGFV